MEADYSVCLQLLLKYPVPDSQHGPHTFVDDAVYLRNHPDFPGGSFIITKYTERSPATPGVSVTSPTTAAARRGLESMRQRALRSGGSQLAGVSVEQFFQGAAKSARAALERGEKLGINQAVRDAVGELRRNMQNLNDARVTPRPTQGGDVAATLSAMDKRSKQLATFLNETVADLKALSASNLDDKVKSLQMIEVAAAKVQFVQIYLEDSTMDVPRFKEEAPPKSDDATKEGGKQETAKKDDAKKLCAAVGKSSPIQSQGKEDVPKKTVADIPPAVPEKPVPAEKKTPAKTAQPAKSIPPAASKALAVPFRSETKEILSNNSPKEPEEPTEDSPSQQTETPGQPAPEQSAAARPPLPAVPTRSTIAQSSFSWMLEPDETTPSAAASKSPPPQAKKRSANNVSRERNAFLFGDGDGKAGASDPLTSNGIFGLESMNKGKDK